MPLVLDASALIAFLRGEAGAESVTERIQQSWPAVYAHSLNLCEVYYDFSRSSDSETAQNAIEDLMRLGLTERNDLDPDFWRAMGQLKATHRRVSLADCAALALTKRLSASLVTADRHEFEALEALSVCEFVFIR